MDAEPNEVTRWSKFKEVATPNIPLVPLKLTMLLYYGAVTLYLPYMTLQMIQVGLNIEEIAIIYSVLPFVGAIMPPIAGAIADKFHCYKLVLIIIVAVLVIFNTALLHVDARLSPNLPSSAIDSNEVPAKLICGSTDVFVCFDNYTWNANNRQEWKINLTLSDCNPVGCDLPIGMSLCFTDGNCTQIPIELSSRFQMDVSLEVLQLPGDDNCTTRVVSAKTDQNHQPAWLVCNCSMDCPVVVSRFSQESNSSTETTIDFVEIKEAERLKHNRGFWLYFIFRIFASGSLATSFSMLDATALKMVKKHKGDLGKQRLFGLIGQGVFAVFGGVILDWTVKGNKEVVGSPDYSIIFYLADGMFILVILLISRLDVDVEHHSETTKLTKSIRKLIRLVDVDIFLIMMLLLGSCWGFLESFLFVFLTELDASSYLLGMTITFASIIGLPFLYISDAIVRKIGSANVIVCAFLAYCVRFFGYSYIWDPWLCLPFEALEAVTIHMMAVASSIYCAAAAPPGLLATLNGFVGSLHYSFGRGLGSFIGGIMLTNFGTRTTFRLLGAGAGIFGVIYFLIHRFCLTKFEKLRVKRASKPAVIVEEAMPMKERSPEENGASKDDGSSSSDEETTDVFLYHQKTDVLRGRRLSAF